MAKTYTADQVISLARDIGKIPNTGSVGWRDQDFLAFMNLYLATTLAPLIMGVREDYYSRPFRTALTGTTARVRVHERAILQAPTDVRVVSSSGAYLPDPELIDPGHVDVYARSTQVGSRPLAYWMEGMDICFSPRASSGYLEQVIALRPGELVLAEDARQVESVSDTAVTLASNPPTSWTTSSTFDAHSSKSGAETIFLDRSITAIAANVLTFSAAPDGSAVGERALAAGDWLCLEGEAAVPGCPYEFHPVLAQATAVKMLETIDKEAHQVQKGILDQMMRANLDLMQPRISDKPKRLRGTPYIGLQGTGG